MDDKKKTTGISVGYFSAQKAQPISFSSMPIFKTLEVLGLAVVVVELVISTVVVGTSSGPQETNARIKTASTKITGMILFINDTP